MPACTTARCSSPLKEFEPSWSRGGDIADGHARGGALEGVAGHRGRPPTTASNGAPKGFGPGYELFSINGKMSGHGEPIRVKSGERVLFHVLNASATEIRSLALPGHTFRVVALDGNPVPMPATVPILWVGTAERISAIVEMTRPGVWLMGHSSDDDRNHGMGIVVEYAERKGAAQWAKPQVVSLGLYAVRQARSPRPATPDETIEITIVKHNAAARGFNLLDAQRRGVLARGDDADLFPYGTDTGTPMKFRNASDDVHPLHFPDRHSFELTRVGGRPTAGVMKDVVMLGGFQELEIHFIADNPGDTPSCAKLGRWRPREKLGRRVTRPRGSRT